jgi:hypothetical protein
VSKRDAWKVALFAIAMLALTVASLLWLNKVLEYSATAATLFTATIAAVTTFSLGQFMRPRVPRTKREAELDRILLPIRSAHLAFTVVVLGAATLNGPIALYGVGAAGIVIFGVLDWAVRRRGRRERGP